MKVYEIKLTKQQLSSLPRHERALFFQLGHVFNEISFLNKLLLMVSNTEAKDLERKGMAVQSMIVARIFIGKVFEAWRMIEKELLEKKLMSDLEKYLPDDAKQALQNLETYFDENDLFRTIRNKFSFHYLSGHIDETLNAIEDNRELKLFIGNRHANTLHDFAEEIVSFGMLRKTDEQSMQAAMDKIIGDLVQSSGMLLTFIGHVSAAIFHLRFGKSWDDFDWIEHEVEVPKNLEAFKIPFFFDVQEQASPNKTPKRKT